MPVNVDAIRSAIKAIDDITQHRHTFEHEGKLVVMRRVLSSEEHEVSKWALGPTDKIGQREFIERVKLGLLSYAIIQIGELDLSMDTVLTGDVLENGIPISSPKHEVLREIMMSHWAAPTFNSMFVEYARLVQITTKKQPKIDGETVDDQISRLEEQIKQLRLTKEQSAKSPLDVIQGVMDRGQEKAESIMDILPQVKASEVPSMPAEPEPRVPRRDPQQYQPQHPQPQFQQPETQPFEAQPQPFSWPPQASQQPQQPQPQPQPQPPPQRVRRPISPEEVRDPHGSSWDPHGGDSFMDSSDPERAVQMENARMAALHREQQQRALDARQQQQQRPVQGSPQVLSSAQRINQQLYETKPEFLDNREGSSAPPLQVQTEPQGTRSINPRFRGRG